MKLFNFDKLLLALSLVLISYPTNAQVGTVLKRVGKHTASEMVDKSIRHNVVDMSKDYVTKSVIDHSMKKRIRKKFMKKIASKGYESWFDYGRKRVFIRLAPTQRSHVLPKHTQTLYGAYLRNSNLEANNAFSPVKKFRTKYLRNRLGKTATSKELKKILEKGPIKLSDKELKQLLDHPEYLREFMMIKTGSATKSIKENFQEFFIRLAQSDPEQVKKLLENQEIRKKIDRAIRGDGYVHEWLMTKNFLSFLVDKKWGADGPFLAMALNKLVQNTEKVLFKKGGSHFLGGTNSKTFHDGLGKIIDGCSNKEELLLAIKKYAKENLTKESYDDFMKIFTEVFDVSKYVV